MMQKGFSLTEIVIVIGLLLLLFAFTSINFVGSVRRPQEAQIIDILISDLRAQQIKAISGKGDNFGIDFSETSYTLTPEDFTIDLPDGYSFISTQPVVFNKGTGETTNTTISLEDSESGEIKNININKYGATY